MNTIAVLRDIIEKHPTSLADDRTIRALLMDCFPGDKRAQNTLMMVVETGVLADMAGKQEIDSFHMYGYIRSVVADYGVSEVIAKRAVSDWAAALGISAEDVSVEDTAVTRQRTEPGVIDYSAVTSSDLVIYGKIIKFSGKGPKVTPEIIIPPGTYLAQAKPGIAARVYDAGGKSTYIMAEIAKKDYECVFQTPSYMDFSKPATLEVNVLENKKWELLLKPIGKPA